jgi:hypothetical protein
MGGWRPYMHVWDSITLQRPFPFRESFVHYNQPWITVGMAMAEALQWNT